MNFFYFILLGGVSAWFGGEVNYTPHSEEHDVDDEELLNITEVKGFPTPGRFIYDNIDKKFPLVMRESIIDVPAYNRWSDDTYFTSIKTLPESAKINSKYFKQDGPWDYFTSDLYLEDGEFSKFVENYKQKDLAIATFLPYYLLKDINLPCGIQCGEFEEDTLYWPILWMANSKLATKIHTDVGDNIICSLRGRLNFTLFENKDRNKLRLVKAHNTISDIQSPSHDFGNDVKARKVDISRGDCFYIPSNTTYKVESNENTLAISIMWKQICHHMIKMDACERTCQSSVPMNGVIFHDFDLTLKKVEIIQRSVESNYKDFVKLLKNQAKFDFEKEKEAEIILSFAGLVFSILDRNGDNTISDEEFTKTSLQDWLKYGERNKDLNSLIKHFNIIHEPPSHTGKRIEL